MPTECTPLRDEGNTSNEIPEMIMRTIEVCEVAGEEPNSEVSREDGCIQSIAGRGVSSDWDGKYDIRSC